MIERIIAYPGGEGNAWADAREYIVRCKDCKHFFQDDFRREDGGVCLHPACAVSSTRREVRKNDYCSWGEGK